MLTKSQKKTYDFIKNYIHDKELSPTLQEISAGIAIKSRGTVSRYVQSLIDLGFLSKQKKKNTSRNLVLTSNISNNSISNVVRLAIPSIPLLGTIAAGLPIEAIPAADHCNINDIIHGDNLYMLRVKGDSMIEEGIYDGDYVVCQPSNHASDGEIVVALIDDNEATLKRFYYNNHTKKVLLCPANSDMTPFEYDQHRVKIQGILRCQLRKY